jgi:hypothetical protein
MPYLLAIDSFLIKFDSRRRRKLKMHLRQKRALMSRIVSDRGPGEILIVNLTLKRKRGAERRKRRARK